MALRALGRYDWSREGLRLWLIKQPGLRWLPFYPSVSSVQQWRLQAAAMVEQKVMPARWVTKADFTAGNLSSLTWFRSRVGLRFAFLEDPIVTGMLAAKPQPGRQGRLKLAAMKEEAAQEAEKGNREQVARSLLGPRGGLPTLKGDLVKLAALLHVQLEDKDTIATIKGKLKGTVAALCQRVAYVPPAPASLATPAASSGGLGSIVDQTSPPGAPLRTEGRMVGAVSIAAPSSAAPSLPTRSVEEIMEAKLLEMDNRYQAMFAQVLSHVMTIQQGGRQADPNEDSDMTQQSEWDRVDDPNRDPRLESPGVLESQMGMFNSPFGA